MNKIVIGIDGGGTKTKFLASDAFGNILYENTLGTLHYLQIGFDGVKSLLEEAVNSILQTLKLNKNDVLAIYVGCPGYGDISADTSNLEKAISDALDPTTYEIGNDMINALAGSLAGKSGINVIAGTGSIGYGKNNSGDSFHSGGWHHYFGGDEGSAHWFGTKLILNFTQQADGRIPKTQLYNHVIDRLSLKDDTDILNLIINEYGLERDKIAQLSTLVTELAELKDPVALSIFEEAAYELTKIYSAVAKNLTFDSDILASYSGGIFKSGDFIVKPLRENLAKLNINLLDPQFEPDIGSIIEALKIAKIPINEVTVNNLTKYS